MKQKLKVSFDNPEHGWVGLTSSQGEESLTIIVECPTVAKRLQKGGNRIVGVFTKPRYLERNRT